MRISSISNVPLPLAGYQAEGGLHRRWTFDIGHVEYEKGGFFDDLVRGKTESCRQAPSCQAPAATDIMLAKSISDPQQYLIVLISRTDIQKLLIMRYASTGKRDGFIFKVLGFTSAESLGKIDAGA